MIYYKQRTNVDAMKTERSFTMKRILITLITLLMMTSALCVTAGASNYDDVAQQLSAIGMFRGTGSSFELDRAPTRAEAAIMLVRLYGAEEEATAAYQTGEIAHPFTDVPGYSAPHVAWLYTKGLTKGTGADTFGSADACSVQNYATFLLRALGYQDGVDFQYSDALAFARQCGFYSEEQFSGEFLRDELAALTYEALATDVKGGQVSLLESLIVSGAVDAQAAKPMTDRMADYRAWAKAYRQYSSETSMDCSTESMITLGVPMGENGEIVESQVVTNVQTAYIRNGSDLQMAVKSTSQVDGVDAVTGMWLKDGYVYLSTQVSFMTMNLKYPYEGEEMQESVEIDPDTSGISALKSITVSTSGVDTVYEFVLNSALVNGLDLITELDEESVTSVQLKEMRIIYTVGASGKIKKSVVLFDAVVQMQEGTETVTVDYAGQITETVNATGSQVRITWPDFSTFVEIDPSLLES